MLGAIYGDIVGSVFEFNNIKTKDFNLFSSESHITDDSAMTIAVAKTLLETQPTNESAFKNALIDNMHDIGTRYPDLGYGGRFFFWLTNNGRSPYNSYGNGSAMRVSPAGFYAKTLEDAEKIAALTAEVTHNHPEGIKGASVIAGLIWLAKTGATMKELKKYADKFYSTKFTVEQIRPTYEFDETCQGSIPQAIRCFLESTSFEDTIRNAISIGGDSDTIAAISGGIAEAYYGMTDAQEKKAFSYLDPYLLEPTEKFHYKYR